MKRPKRHIARKGMIDKLSLSDINEALYEIADNGDMHGYDGGDEGYYQDYKDEFDNLADGAYRLMEAIEDVDPEAWNDMTVALLGDIYQVYGYDAAEYDYFKLANGYDEDFVVSESYKRLMRMTKDDLLSAFRRVLGVIISYADIKAAHDCLTSIVEELDDRGAILEAKNQQINRIYEDYTNTDHRQLDALVNSISPRSRMWVE